MGKDIDKRNRRNRENAMKSTQILQVPISTSAAGVLMETVMWLAEAYCKYSTMMLYHSITNSEEEQIAKNIVKEQRIISNHQQTFYSRVNSISKETGIV